MFAPSVSSVTVNGQVWPRAYFSFDAGAQRLVITNLKLDTRVAFQVGRLVCISLCLWPFVMSQFARLRMFVRVFVVARFAYVYVG